MPAKNLRFLAISASSLTVRVLRFAALLTGYTSVVRLPPIHHPVVGEPMRFAAFHFPGLTLALAPLAPCRHPSRTSEDTSRQDPVSLLAATLFQPVRCTQSEPVTVCSTRPFPRDPGLYTCFRPVAGPQFIAAK